MRDLLLAPQFHSILKVGFHGSLNLSSFLVESHRREIERERERVFIRILTHTVTVKVTHTTHTMLHTHTHTHALTRSYIIKGLFQFKREFISKLIVVERLTLDPETIKFKNSIPFKNGR